MVLISSSQKIFPLMDIEFYFRKFNENAFYEAFKKIDKIQRKFESNSANCILDEFDIICELGIVIKIFEIGGLNAKVIFRTVDDGEKLMYFYDVDPNLKKGTIIDSSKIKLTKEEFDILVKKGPS